MKHLATGIILLLSTLACACGAKPPDPKPEPEPPLPQLTRVTTLTGKHINSPKSVIFSQDGRCFYVNSLEAMETLVCDSSSLRPVRVVSHEFDAGSAGLFLNGESTAFDYNWFGRVPEDRRNCFGGKPVEAALTHSGRWLWVTYYRRSWDRWANSPSAVAVIDTLTQNIVRVIPTGPLPKMLAPSPDGRYMAVVHWGDNSVGIMDISGSSPKDFRWIRLMVDQRRLPVKDFAGDRDAACGFCLRGAVFSANSRWLFVGRAFDGGITIFDMQTFTRLGTFTGLPPAPRHMVLSRDGTKLYVSSSASGTITGLDVEDLVRCVRTGADRAKSTRSLTVGKSVRTIALSPDGRWLFAACSGSCEVAMVDLEKWTKVASVPATPWPVGLAVNPAGDMLVTTSQSLGGRQGQAVDVWRISPAVGPAPPPDPKPIAPAASETGGGHDSHVSSAGGTNHAADHEQGTTADVVKAPPAPPVPPSRGLDSAND